jgi:hypothetical protein
MITLRRAVTCHSRPRRRARPRGPRGASVSRPATVPAWTFDGPAVDLACTWHRCWRGGQISRSLAHYGQGLALPEPAQDWVLGRRLLLLGAKSRDHSTGWQRR